ncbi:MAG TPA: hypothetical protein VGP33_08800, partial [Chloroflexota bacterium]|nr:hypothetical protein [Chloroflexota bacterium]
MKTARPPLGGGLSSRDAPPLDLPFRFFLTALVALAVLMVLAPWQAAMAQRSSTDPWLVVLVHWNTLGVIGATIMGASFQLLPVVLQAPLASVRLGRLAWCCYVPGVVAFLLGFSQGWTPLLGLGGTLLALAIGLYGGIVIRTLASSHERDVVFWHIAVAVAGLLMGAVMGLLLAVSQPGGLLGGLTFRVLAAHITLMLGAWVTPMLTGIAYRLVGMFTLSEDRLHVPTAWAELALTAGGAWLFAAVMLFGLGRVPAVAGAAAVFLGLCLFGGQLVRLYRRRRRRTFDIHMPFIIMATGSALLALGLILFGLVAGRTASDSIWRAVVWLLIVGWAETAIQGFLYKIGAFLTWLHRYAPLAGRRPVPKLEDLYGRRTALVGWAAWSAGVAIETLAILSGAELPARLAGGVLSIGLGALLVNALRMSRHWRAAVSAPPATGGPGQGSRGAAKGTVVTTGRA